MEAKPRLPDERVNLPDTHPLADAATLITGVVGVALVVFAVIAYFVEIAIWMLPVETEASIAAELWPQEASAAGEAVGDRQARVQQLLGELAEGWPENPYALQLRIMDTPEPNAFAAPGGIVMVTTGLLEQSQSENELAFVLGHEIGHFRNRDHLRGLGQGLLFQLVLAAVGLGGADLSLAGQTGVAASLSFSREQEREADRFGLELVDRRYGHVDGAGLFFERVAAIDPASASLPTFVSTHPGLRERAKAVRELAVERGYALDGPLRPRL